MLDTSVKYTDSQQLGSPSLQAGPGALIAWLDMHLITGWGLTATTSITISNEVGTAIFSGGHPATGDAVIGFVNVPGAWIALGNERRVFGVSTNSFTFDASGLPNGTINGVSVKVPGMGWEKPFYAANTAVYRSATSGGSRHYLRVDDSNDAYALVKAYASMTGVDSGASGYPGDSVDARWMKSIDTTPSQFSWIAGDNKSFLYGVQSYDYLWMFGFGEYVAEDPGEPNNSFIAINDGAPAQGNGHQDWYTREDYGGVYLLNNAGQPALCGRGWMLSNNLPSGSVSSNAINPSGGKIFASQQYIIDF